MAARTLSCKFCLNLIVNTKNYRFLETESTRKPYLEILNNLGVLQPCGYLCFKCVNKLNRVKKIDEDLKTIVQKMECERTELITFLKNLPGIKSGSALSGDSEYKPRVSKVPTKITEVKTTKRPIVVYPPAIRLNSRPNFKELDITNELEKPLVMIIKPPLPAAPQPVNSSLFATVPTVSSIGQQIPISTPDTSNRLKAHEKIKLDPDDMDKSDVTEYICSICDESFLRYTDLEIHCEKHTTIDNTDVINCEKLVKEDMEIEDHEQDKNDITENSNEIRVQFHEHLKRFKQEKRDDNGVS